jgi:hypothetical protein
MQHISTAARAARAALALLAFALVAALASAPAHASADPGGGSKPTGTPGACQVE